ncbi:tetratricopeptide repeat protein [Acanthopleuribacter pedis]|uniref:Winged helix-turn-helix domain-containing protein n=1 Tax=Acanthopleuribacter pedis TaxID=442870 RepID=A0A8J7Q4K6_9BACT|nr:tetratricopeptide repeat protein [Acanthopleuribacter pedis]MBO1318054.1 winged helix-turn-helix domain-containing protein [Acanthopleuribacter pedis]
MSPRFTWHFGVFSYDPATGNLVGPAGTQRLHEKPALVLETLVEAGGDVVSRKTLQGRLWPDETHVDFANNLNAAVKRLRDALGDRAAEPTYIETLPRKGYRFLVTAERRVVAPSQPVAPKPPETKNVPTASAPFPAQPAWWQALAVSLLVLTFTWVLVAFQAERTARLPTGKIMLAVLPLQNTTGDPGQGVFVDGLTEELINHLGRLQPARLGVISRTSAMTYRDSETSVAEIARALQVDFVLEGALRRGRAGGRINLQLIQIEDQTQLWSEHYDFDDSDWLAVQDRIAVKVAKTMALELLEGAMPAVARAELSDTRAYRAYLRGRHAWFSFNREAYLRAEAHFQEALSVAPEAAVVHAGLADTYNLLAFTDHLPQAEAFAKAKKAALQALRFDPDSAEAHNALAFVLLYHDRDFTEAERHFRTALDLNPGYAMAHHWYAGLLSARERHDEALSAMKQALTLDPVSLSVASDLGWYYLFADRDEAAVEAFKATLALNPDYGWAMHGLAVAYRRLGLAKQAVFTLRNDLHLNGMSPTETAYLDGSDPDAAWRAWLEQRATQFGTPEAPASGVRPLDAVMTLAQLGRLDEAFAWLEGTPDNTWLIFLRVDPRFDGLRPDPRFVSWCERIGIDP